ncbi:hypothetical protein CBR_g26492 [Chara braunii]|uniref:ABC transmembrane type-1 domain-containing protein n=1 Tax=Chara braunii TaxID=69332 RepID=A0A388L8A3_CHABU|nr:hypothetical protein CBR_g26492 [Chara braunii]|eukprot:GBG78462.1 hypothetical protein CBR_g26492 [Chara braunii]
MPSLLARRWADDRGEKARALVGGARGKGAVNRREQQGGFPIATGGTDPRFSHLAILHPKISCSMPLSMPHVHVAATWTHDADVDDRMSSSRRTTTPTSIRFVGRDITQCRRRRRKAGTRAHGVGTESAATWGKGDRTTTCATKCAAVRRTATPRSEKRAGERRRLRVLASSTSTESERNARTDPDGAAVRKGNLAANHVPSTSSMANSSGETSGEASDDQMKSPDIRTLWYRFIHVAAPYWSSEDKTQARLRVAAVFLMTLATTGISVAFNFLGRDFYNALSSKDQEQFTKQLLYYLGAFVVGIPVFVIRDYLRETLALRWRAWMTKEYIGRYFGDRTFYNIQSASLIDNPDQRIVDDIASFTVTSLAFALAIFNACIDLISFSGILYGIYPPLFGVLIVYSLGGTALSVALGKELLISSRNLDFFTSGYKYLIQLLPAAVVAPLYFSGKIEFGVISQSFSAFNHVLSDFSIIVFQFQAISSFSAVVDRLGEFTDLLEESDKQRAKREGEGEGEGEEEVPGAVDGQVDVVQRSTINLIDSPYQGRHQVLAASVAASPPSEMASVMRYAAAAAADDDDEGVNSRQESSQYGTGSNSSEDLSLRPGRIFRESAAAPSSQDAAVLLEIEDLTLFTPQYTNRLILNLSLTIREGEHLLVLSSNCT